jgi:hypothetical protein
MAHLMEEVRAAIEAGTFGAFREAFHRRYRPPDAEAAQAHRERRRNAQERGADGDDE